MVRWASGASQARLNIGRVRKPFLEIRNERWWCLGSWYLGGMALSRSCYRDGDVGDIAIGPRPSIAREFGRHCRLCASAWGGLTKRMAFAAHSPATTARARASWA